MTNAGWTLIDVTDLGAITYKTVPAAHAPVEFICRDATPPSVTSTAPSSPRSSLSKSSKWSWTVIPSPRKQTSAPRKRPRKPALKPANKAVDEPHSPPPLVRGLPEDDWRYLGLPVPRKDEELRYLEQRGLISLREKLNAWADEERVNSQSLIEAKWNGRIARGLAAQQPQAMLDIWRHHRDRDVAECERRWRRRADERFQDRYWEIVSEYMQIQNATAHGFTISAAEARHLVKTHFSNFVAIARDQAEEDFKRVEIPRDQAHLEKFTEPLLRLDRYYERLIKKYYEDKDVRHGQYMLKVETEVIHRERVRRVKEFRSARRAK
ncbi:hypothetical protein EWM64_g6036 [Hericium alpestre]|uniref:Uncharacterized protein n=1 Tax=Hericium alpestre TaxID=135208 RepID=A0A4Y9ZTS0_9AGAM|nr:hypothetical protein EWM64_g6036 [Hericium alpestre]